MNTLEARQNGQISTKTEHLIRAGKSKNTIRAYRRITTELETWLGGQSISDTMLASYITELHEAGKSPNTIAQVVAAVKWRLNLPGDLKKVLPLTASTLSGIRRKGKSRGRGQVDGMVWSDVERVCAFCEIEGTVRGLRDSALIRLMSDCLLRVSEAVAVDVEDVSNVLQVHQSKTDQDGQGEALYICESTRQVIKRYRERGGITEGALFRRVRRGDNITSERLTERSARRVIVDWSRDAGIEGLISGHSLRVGSAVSLAQAGASVVDMQTAGRWKSSQMPAHYAKAELAERGAIARFKEKGGQR